RRVDRVELIHHVAPLLRGPLGACEATMPALMWLYEQLDHVHLLDLGEAQEVIACGEKASRDDVLEARSPVVAYEGCNVGSQQPPERIVEQTWVDLAQVFGVDPCPTWCVRQQRADDRGLARAFLPCDKDQTTGSRQARIRDLIGAGHDPPISHRDPAGLSSPAAVPR